MKKKIVIIGGGFAGLMSAKIIAPCSDFEITVLDKKNHHLFQPLLYQVATAALSPADIAVPIRSILSRYQNVDVFLEEVTLVDRQKKRIQTATGKSYDYDYLIVAPGAQTSYFGNDHWQSHAISLKSLEEAVEMRRRILLAFEEAEKSEDVETKKAYLIFVVVGGGPTGVELAGAIAEIGRQTLLSDFRHIDLALFKVILLEGRERILTTFHPDLSAKTTQTLHSLGVEVRLHSEVQDINESGVQLKNQFIKAKTILWAAGVEASVLAKTLNTPLDPQGRVITTPYLHLPDDPFVYVLGDLAHVQDALGRPLPGLAPVAIQEGAWAGKNIKRHHQELSLQKFIYKDKGQMATIGRNQAIAQMGNFSLHGFFAWLAWLLVHIYYLIGFKNRIFVFLQWAWSYFTFKRGARLITWR